MSHPVKLPPLRQNLQLLPGSPDEDGAPRWLLFDVVGNRYFTISRTTLDLVQHWAPGLEMDAFLVRLAEQQVHVEGDEVRAFLDFLVANNLTESRSAEGADRLHQQSLANHKNWWRWLLHNYLFVRIPLFRPDAWLNRWTPRLRWLFTPQMHYGVLAMGVTGALLVLRDWDRFQATFLHFFNLQGLIWYGLALVVVKSAHEMGHAFVAKRQGCRVASMGVAFLVMLPVLYTDTTDAWKLRSRKARLKIVTAGVRTELYIAMVATFLWNILPEGPLRSVAFFLATASWVASLLVNISPFLRFDGYYAFSDALGIENLQSRAFALGRWKLRQMLFGLDDPVPEPLPRHRARLLIGYAWATWIYRFFLFLGIALLVYHFFFKVLGIFLFAVELLWFLVMPIWREVAEWRKRRSGFQLGVWQKAFWSGVGVLMLWAALPLRTSMEMPAVLQAAQVQTLFASEAAVVESVGVQDGEWVQQGAVLLTLRSLELERSLVEVGEELHVARLRLARIASSEQERSLLGVTSSQITRLEEQQAGLRERVKRLNVTAPFEGRVRGREQLHPGRWVNPAMPLLTLVNPSAVKLGGLVAEQGLRTLQPGQSGVFIADRSDGPRLGVTLDSIDVGAAFALPYPELASTNGGPLPVRVAGDASLVPEGAFYHVTFSAQETGAGEGQMREPGMIVVDGRRRSWLWAQLQRALAVLVRESGF